MLKVSQLLLALCFVTWVACGWASPTKGLQNTTHIDETPGTTDDGAILPNTLDLQFGLGTGKMTLNLTRNNHVTSNVPVFMARDDTIEEYTNHTHDDFAVYTDMNSHASFLVQAHVHEGKQTRLYRGSFRVEEEEFVLEPQTEQPSRRKRSTDLDLELNHMEYVVYKREIEKDEFEDDSVERPELSRMNEQISHYIGSSGYYPRGRQVYTVEMMLFIDYAIFNQWFQRSRSFYYENKVSEAVDNIRYYFSHIVNGIDMRYQSINDPDFAIYVYLKGFVIAQTPGASPWTEQYPNKEYDRGRHYTYANLALDSFELWLNQSAHKLPSFDQASLYTGNILFNGRRSDGSRRPISGLADIKGICSYYSASINQDAGQYASIQTGAHELGHNLGAQHDNPVFNWCESRDQYVMATSPGELNDRNFKNPFTFSPCSKSAFRQFLFYLTIEGKNCLLSDNGQPIRLPFGELPGRRYNLTQQCQIKNGFHSYYCGGHNNDMNMCKRIMCFIPELNRCADPVEQRGYDGTSCADRKWCESGECVYHPQAPPASDFCLSGDYLGRFHDGRRCSELISQEPWQCYENPYTYDEQCCHSCQKIKDASKPGCEYGDHAAYCQKVKTNTPWDCYREQVQRDCCATCEEIQKQKPATLAPACKFGDKVSWCATMSKSSCYAEKELCCETCPKLAENDNKDCLWGDRATWCRTLEPRRCYSSSETCCGTCKPWGPLGCEFGDKSRYCNQVDCKDPYYRKSCCHTCGTFSGTPTDCRDQANWCSSIRPGDCYSQSTRTQCCQTCAIQKVGPPGCEYGDKYSWCNKIYCDTEKENCCKTCQ